MQNKELSNPKEKKMDIKKKWTLRLITPSSQLVQPLADLQNSLPSLLRDYPEQPWRRTGPLKTVDFHIYADKFLTLFLG